MREEISKRQAGSGVSVRVVVGAVVLVAVALALRAFYLAERVDAAQAAAAEGERRNVACVEAIRDLQAASDFLTTQARTFVVTGRRESMDAYVNEVEVTRRRGRAVEVLRDAFAGSGEAYEALSQALAASDALAETELAAMRLAAGHYGVEELPDEVAGAEVPTPRDGESDLNAATELVLGAEYDEAKRTVSEAVTTSSSALLAVLDAELAASKLRVGSLLTRLRVVVALLLCAVMVLVLALSMYVLRPLGGYVRRIRNGEPLVPEGARELHYLACAYNEVYEDNAHRIEQLRALAGAFRTTDLPRRIEDDEFAVVMTNAGPDLRGVVVQKVERVATILAETSDDLPPVTLSVGAAFSAEGMDGGDIHRAASAALEDARESGAGGVIFYGEHDAG